MKKIIKFRDMKDYKERVKKMFKALYNDTHKKYEKNVTIYSLKLISIIEKDVHSEWNYGCVHPTDRLRSFYHECWRFSRNYVQRRRRGNLCHGDQ